MKTTTLKKSEFQKEWHLLDATNISVGRLASRVSLILKGKNKPQYSPNLPVGDGVIIINTDKVRFSGNKTTDKKYYKHTGHPGGIKEITPEKLKEKNKSDDIIKKAIKGMLPNIMNKLATISMFEFLKKPIESLCVEKPPVAIVVIA